MRRFSQLWVACLLCFACMGAQAAVQVQADRESVVMGEEFVLLFSVEGEAVGNPDFSPLGQSFEITGTSTSTNVQMVNGQVTQQSRWKVRLFPKTTGSLQVPPIQFGAESSPALTLSVQAEEAADANGKADILVELVAEPPNPYVQQQVVVTQRLLHAVPLQPTQASMTHPELEKGKGIIQQLGNTRNMTTTRDGKTYQAIERRYAVFPQVSGELVLGRTVFQGVLDDQRNRRRDPFGLSGKQVRRFSQPLSIPVQPQPAASTGTWLPANGLTLNAYWHPSTDTLKAGEPVTLTLAIMAEGLMAEQLPALEVKPPFGIKGYANQPEFRNDLSGKQVVGIREEKWVLLGTRDGEYTLPEITLNWWNLKTNQTETARIAPITLKVVGAGSSANPAEAGGSSGEGGELDERKLLRPPESQTVPLAASPDGGQESGGWFWWMVWAALLGGVLGGVAWWWFRYRPVGMTREPVVARPKQPPLQALQQACLNNDAQAAFQAVHDWIRDDLALSPPTLAYLRVKADLPLRQALDDLSTVLYASVQHVWEGRALWEAVQAYNRRAAQPVPAANSSLAAMYPE